MRPSLVVSIDTEEDNWGWASTSPYRCENARALPGLVRFLQRHDVRPTLFVTHAYLSDPSARDTIRDLAAEEWIEIGCHVHPWNTPPSDERIPRRTMLYEYPLDLQRAKIRVLTEMIENVTGCRPTAFRAGRFGFGPLTSRALHELGYEVDSSVTPHWDWRQSSHGPSYLEAPLGVYRIRAGGDVLEHRDEGEIVEVPLTSGYKRFRADQWPSVTDWIEGRIGRTVHLGGIAARLGDIRRVILTPEAHDLDDMLSLGHRVLDGGVGHLQVFFHSSSLVPGLTPFTPTQADLGRFYDRLDEFLERIRADTALAPLSVTEAARQAPPPASRPTSEDPIRVQGSGGRAPRGLEQLRDYGGTMVALGYIVRRLLWRLGRYRRYADIRWSEVDRLVFVCSGNICRSAYAEYWARERGIDAVSIGVRTLNGKPASSMAMKVALDRGVNMDAHRTTRVEDFEPEPGDLFVAMEPWQAEALMNREGWTDPHQVTLLGLWIPDHGPVVLDPYGRSEACFVHCLTLLEEGIGRLLAARQEASSTHERLTESGSR